MNITSPLKRVFAVSILLISGIIHADPAHAATCATGGTCVIGDTGPGGGTVFFVRSTYTPTSISTQNGARTTSLTSAELAALPFDYLEAAPAGWDNSSATDPTINYSNDNNSANYNQISGSKIGTGKANTDQMVSLYSSDNSTNNAAIRIHNATIGGKSDWWLPSNDELILMFTNLYKASPSIGGWRTDTNIAYRTSTQAKFFVFHWSAAYEGNNFKFDAANWPYPVKAVRGFSASAGGGGSSGSNDDESKRKEAERIHQEKIRQSQIALLSTIRLGGRIEAKDLADSELPYVTVPSLAKANTDLLKLPIDERVNIQAIIKVIKKYEIIEKLGSSSVSSVTSREMKEFKVISSDTPQASHILWNLNKVTIEDRNSEEKISKFFADQVAEYTARMDHLAATKARIAARRG